MSVKIIMAGHRQCVTQNIVWSITEDLSELMKLPSDFPKCFPVRRIRVRPDLPKETRDEMKANVQKIYIWNNDIRTCDENKGIPMSASFSLRRDGTIVLFGRRVVMLEEQKTERLVKNESMKTVNWNAVKELGWT